MMRKTLSCLLSLLLLLAVCQIAGAQSQIGNQVTSVEQIKIGVAKLGVGEKARGTVTLNSGAKIKGYVAQAGDEDFVIRDRKTNAPTTIRYADVGKVQADKGHSKAKHLGIGIGIGVGAFLAVLLIAFSRLND
jgi:hypothetical protein